MRLERSYSRKQQIRVLDYLMFHRVDCNGQWKRRRIKEDKYELVSTLVSTSQRPPTYDEAAAKFKI